MSITRSIKNYFLRRMDSVNAWFGVIGLLGEVFLHFQHSTLMIVFFVSMIFVPDASFSQFFGGAAVKLRALDQESEAAHRPKGGFTAPRN